MTVDELRNLEEEKQDEHWHQVQLVSKLKRRGIAYKATPNENKYSGIIRTILIGLNGKVRGLKLANKIIFSLESKMKAEGK